MTTATAWQWTFFSAAVASAGPATCASKPQADGALAKNEQTLNTAKTEILCANTVQTLEATTLVSVRIASTTPLQSTESTYKTTNGGYRSEPAQRGPLLHDVGH